MEPRGATFEEAVHEVRFFIEIGGVNTHNCEHIHRLICKHGETSHEVFQEAAEQIRSLIAQGDVAESDLVSAQSN